MQSMRIHWSDLRIRHSHGQKCSRNWEFAMRTLATLGDDGRLKRQLAPATDTVRR